MFCHVAPCMRLRPCGQGVGWTADIQQEIQTNIEPEHDLLLKTLECKIRTCEAKRPITYISMVDKSAISLANACGLGTFEKSGQLAKFGDNSV